MLTSKICLNYYTFIVMVYHSVELTHQSQQMIDTGVGDHGYLRYLNFYIFLLIRTIYISLLLTISLCILPLDECLNAAWKCHTLVFPLLFVTVNFWKQSLSCIFPLIFLIFSISGFSTWNLFIYWVLKNEIITSFLGSWFLYIANYV